MRSWRSALERVRKEPRAALRTAIALARGHYYRAKFRILGRRVVIGRLFQVTGPLVIRGPGPSSSAMNARSSRRALHRPRPSHTPRRP